MLLGYGLGDFGLNIYWNSLSLILVFWYADVVGVDPRTAGLIYFVGLIWDAISDPIVASIASRNRSRYGAYRPFILYGGVGLSLTFCLLFWGPPLEGAVLAIYLAAVHIVFRTSYTLVAVPYAALSSRITFSSEERTELSGFRMGFAFLGLLIISGAWFPLSRFFGAGDESDPNGHFITACIGAVLALAALGICFLTTKERTLPGDRFPDDASPLKSFVDALRTNNALRVLLIVIMLQSAAISSFSIPLAFYLEANEALLAQKETVMTAYAIATLLAVPFWTIMGRRFSRRFLWVLASAWVAIWGSTFMFFGPWVVAGLPLNIVLTGAGFGGFGVLIWAIIPDTVEYGQFVSGKRAEGPVFGTVLLVQKTSSGIVGLAVGMMLSWVGYDAALPVQTDLVASNIGKFLVLTPSILLVLSSLIILKLPLNKGLHARMVDKLSS